MISDETLKSVLYEDVLLIFSHVDNTDIAAKTEEVKIITPHEPTVLNE